MTRILLAGAAIAALASAAAAAAQSADQPKTVTRTEILAEAETSFKAMDANNDGVLTKAELEAAQNKALAAAEAERKSEVAAEFKKLDIDNNGSLSLAEFEAVARPVKARVTPDQALAEFDSNKDSKISLEEYRKPRLAMFDKVDANHDGTITTQELAAARKR